MNNRFFSPSNVFFTFISSFFLIGSASFLSFIIHVDSSFYRFFSAYDSLPLVIIFFGILLILQGIFWNRKETFILVRMVLWFVVPVIVVLSSYFVNNEITATFVKSDQCKDLSFLNGDYYMWISKDKILLKSMGSEEIKAVVPISRLACFSFSE